MTCIVGMLLCKRSKGGSSHQKRSRQPGDLRVETILSMLGKWWEEGTEGKLYLQYTPQADGAQGLGGPITNWKLDLEA